MPPLPEAEAEAALRRYAGARSAEHAALKMKQAQHGRNTPSLFPQVLGFKLLAPPHMKQGWIMSPAMRGIRDLGAPALHIANYGLLCNTCLDSFATPTGHNASGIMLSESYAPATTQKAQSGFSSAGPSSSVRTDCPFTCCSGYCSLLAPNKKEPIIVNRQRKKFFLEEHMHCPAKMPGPFCSQLDQLG